jgi:hypothetical protein
VYFFAQKVHVHFLHVSSLKSLQSLIKRLQGSASIIVENVPIYYYSSLADK